MSNNVKKIRCRILTLVTMKNFRKIGNNICLFLIVKEKKITSALGLYFFINNNDNHSVREI